MRGCGLPSRLRRSSTMVLQHRYEPVECPVQGARYRLDPAPPFPDRGLERAPRIAKHVAPEFDAMPSKQWNEPRRIREQVAPGSLISMLGQLLAIRIAEHVLEEELGVAA